MVIKTSITSFFVAGIIQGSIKEEEIHNQDYRQYIKDILKKRYPKANIQCSIELYPDSLTYSEAKQRVAFFDLMQKTGEADILIVYLPEASMGSAIEMWEAYRNKHVIIAISPLNVNWVVRFLSSEIIPDLTSFTTFVENGSLDKYVK